MSISINLYYRGRPGCARAFAEEMESSGTADAIRAEDGNTGYRYFVPIDDPNTVLLIDSWRDRAALDAHHASPAMEKISRLREKYDLHMTVQSFTAEETPDTDNKYIRK